MATVVSMAALVGGCGEDRRGDGGAGGATSQASGAQPAATPTPRAPAGVSRNEVIAALGVTRGRDENGVPNSDPRAGCYAFKIFAGPEDNMRAYVEIGDPVAANPSKTAGAVVGNYKGVSLRKCVRLFERRLAKLR